MRLGAVVVSVTLLAMLTGCATDGADPVASRNESPVTELARLEKEAKARPGDLSRRTRWMNRRSAIINDLLAQAQGLQQRAEWDKSEETYRQVLDVDASNEQAWAGLQYLGRKRRHVQLLKEGTAALEKQQLDEAAAIAELVLREEPDDAQALALRKATHQGAGSALEASPQLKSRFKRPVSLEFRDANIRMVFDLLGKSSGINFVLDRDVRPDQKTSIAVRNASVEEALGLLLATNKLEMKVVSETGVLVYANTPEKIREYQGIVIKAFYLAYADAKQTAAMIKSLLKTPEIYTDEKLNLVMVRDTPQIIDLAEKLVRLQDLNEPEVMLELEVLEVQRSRLQDLGIVLPSQLTLTPLPATGSQLTLKDLSNLSGARTGASISSAIINLKKEVGAANILANPRIRAKNREKAKILIGDKVPVITTTSTSTGFVAESVQYVEVGLKLEVEPNVYLREEVAMRVALEVSSLVREVRSTTGTLTYQIGTRTASTLLSLRDGETQVLAGLINDSDRNTSTRVPGLGDFPVLGRLFSSDKNERQKTEIVLAITPRVVRSLVRPEGFGDRVWYGTEASPGAKPLRFSPVASTEKDGPAAAPPGAPLRTEVETPDAGQGAAPPSTASAAERKPASGPLAVRFEGPEQVKAGEPFELKLRVTSPVAIRSFPLQIAFNPDALQIQSVKEGDFFNRKGASNFASNVDGAQGKIFIAASQSDSVGALGEGILLSMTAVANAGHDQGEIRLLSASPLTLESVVSLPAMPTPLRIKIVP